VIIQIYGITVPEDAELVCSLGADQVGLVLDEGMSAWDSVDEPTMHAIIRTISPSVRIVALSLSTDPERIRRTVDTTRPAILHLARAADAMTSEDIAQIRQAIAPVQVMTTIPIRDRSAVTTARRLEAVSDFLLLDTVHPSSGIVGATGISHDWTISARVRRAVSVPVVLAGGLGPDNVGDAIAAVEPWGVDSETLTSRDDDRRRKDPDRVRHFVEFAHNARQEKES
jgi:phosphoribosylanthranilate isomerase